MISLKGALTSSALGKCARVLPSEDRRKLFYVVLIQTFLAILDLIAVMLIGVVGAIAVSGVKAATPSQSIQAVLDFLSLESFSVQSQATILGVSAGILLVARTLFSIFLTTLAQQLTPQI